MAQIVSPLLVTVLLGGCFGPGQSSHTLHSPPDEAPSVYKTVEADLPRLSSVPPEHTQDAWAQGRADLSDLDDYIKLLDQMIAVEPAPDYYLWTMDSKQITDRQMRAMLVDLRGRVATTLNPLWVRLEPGIRSKYPKATAGQLEMIRAWGEPDRQYEQPNPKGWDKLPCWQWSGGSLVHTRCWDEKGTLQIQTDEEPPSGGGGHHHHHHH